MTKEEFDSILEEAFKLGYEDANNDINTYIEEVIPKRNEGKRKFKELIEKRIDDAQDHKNIDNFNRNKVPHSILRQIKNSIPISMDELEKMCENRDEKVYSESNKETKDRNREIARKVLEKRYQKAWDKEDNDERYVMNRQLSNGKYPNNPHIIPFKNGKIKDVQSMRYWRTSRYDDPYRDDTDRYMNLNKRIKNKTISKNEKENYKDEIKSALRRAKKYRDVSDSLYNKKRLPK